MQLQKAPKCGILAPSELSQPIPLIFLHHNGLFSGLFQPSQRTRWHADEEYYFFKGDYRQHSLLLHTSCNTCAATTKAQAWSWDVSGEVSKRLLCKVAKVALVQLSQPALSQTWFVKSLKFLSPFSNTNNSPLFYHIYHVLDGMNVQINREGVVRT